MAEKFRLYLRLSRLLAAYFKLFFLATAEGDTHFSAQLELGLDSANQGVHGLAMSWLLCSAHP